MSRTSKTLLRLGVPSLAAATLVAGVPAFLGTASAAHVNQLTLTANDGNDAAAGTCVPFTATITFNTGEAPRAEEIDVVISEGGATPTATQDVDFCTAPSTVADDPTTAAVNDEGTLTPSAPNSGDTDSGPAGSSDRAEFTTTRTTPANGATRATASVTFGVVATEPGAVNVLAFYEVDGSANDNNRFDAGEFNADRTVTFGPGGPAGSNEAANAVDTLTFDEAATTNAVAGESRRFSVLATNSNAAGPGDTQAPAGLTPDSLAGVTVRYQVEDGGDIQRTGVLGVTNNDGIATGTVPFPATDTGEVVRFFVNQTDGATANFDAGSEPDETSTVVTTAAPTTARTVNVVPLADSDTPTAAAYQESPAVNPRTDGDRTFRAVVENTSSSTTDTTGTQVLITVSGGDGDETITVTRGGAGAGSGGSTGQAEATTVTFPAGSNDDSTTSSTNSVVEYVVNDPDEATGTIPSGQVLTTTVSVRGQQSSDSETLTFAAVPSDARNIDLTPEQSFTPAGGVSTFTARVIDGRGNPVAGVPVDFSETGPGAFRSGGSTVNNVETDRNGNASVEVTSLQGEQGQQTITATIDATTFTDDAAGTPSGNTRAGNRSDTAVNNVGIASPAPSATQTASPAPSATSTATATPTGTATAPTNPVCTSPLTVTLDREEIVPTLAVRVTVTGAAPGALVDLQAYSRPSTDYFSARTTAADENGRIVFDVTPGTNTRLFAQCVSARGGEGQPGSPSLSKVINVRTALSLSVVRNGTRNYTFQGRILPRRADQLITLYRVENDGTRVITSQLKTDSTGTYRFRRQFTGSGTFGFLARTGQTLTNASGESTSPQRQISREYLETGRGTPRPTAIF